MYVIISHTFGFLAYEFHLTQRKLRKIFVCKKETKYVRMYICVYI